MARPREYDPEPLTVLLANPDTREALDEILVERILNPMAQWVDDAAAELQERGGKDVNVQVLRLAVIRRLEDLMHEWTRFRAAEALADGIPRVGIAHALGWASGSTVRKNLGDLDGLVAARREANRTGKTQVVDFDGADFEIDPR